MRTHHIFEQSQETLRAGSKIYNNVKTIRILAKGVSTEDPVGMFINAVISVSDALSSYCLYASSHEQTRQLEIKLQAARAELSTFKQELALEASRISGNIAAQLDRVAHGQKVFEATKGHMIWMKEIVTEQRKQHPDAKSTREVEAAYIRAMGLYAVAALQFVSK